jgi:hypothetical protein
MKRGVGNVFWIIIAAIIALVVMVILLSIFSNQTGDFQDDLESCLLKGGTCSTECIGQVVEGTNCGDKKDGDTQLVCCVTL